MFGGLGEQKCRRCCEEAPLTCRRCPSYSDYWESHQNLLSKRLISHCARIADSPHEWGAGTAKKRKKEASRVPKSLSFARNDAYQNIVTIWFIADPDSAFKPSLTNSFEATTHTRTNRKKANRSIHGRPSISSRFSNGQIRTAPGRPQFRTTETNCRNRQLGTGDDPCSAAVAESALSSNLAVEHCLGNRPCFVAADGERMLRKIRNVCNDVR